MGFHAGTQEILARSHHYRTVVVRRADRFCARQCRGAVYLYDLLVKAPPVLMLLLFVLVRAPGWKNSLTLALEDGFSMDGGVQFQLSIAIDFVLTKSGNQLFAF